MVGVVVAPVEVVLTSTAGRAVPGSGRVSTTPASAASPRTRRDGRAPELTWALTSTGDPAVVARAQVVAGAAPGQPVELDRGLTEPTQGRQLVDQRLVEGRRVRNDGSHLNHRAGGPAIERHRGCGQGTVPREPVVDHDRDGNHVGHLIRRDRRRMDDQQSADMVEETIDGSLRPARSAVRRRPVRPGPLTPRPLGRSAGTR